MFLTYKEFQPANISYGFFTKKIAGSSHEYKYQYPQHIRNHKLVAESLILPTEKIALVEQKHTNNIVFTKDYNNYPIADGQLTNLPGIALGVLTADCVPILLADEKQQIIAAVHSGWRGARSGIIENIIEKMKEYKATNITALIGPCIKQRSYEVDKNFYNDFLDEISNNQKYFIPSVKLNHYMFDLTSYVSDKLKKLEVQVYDLNRNTYEEDQNFFSFRRTTHQPTSVMGSQISVIMIND